MNGLVDLHHHLLPCVDDGPDSLEETCRMLLSAWKNGVTCLAATAHAHPGREPFPAQAYLEGLRQARLFCQERGLPITLYPGSEILYTHETLRLLQAGEIPTLGGSRAVLVEFFPDESFDCMVHAARTLGNAGYTMVLAHAERYPALRAIRRADMLHTDLGVRLQVNCNTFLRRKSPALWWWLERMMRRGLVDLAASDSHNTSTRPCRMQACYQAIAARWGEETARRLCRENPMQLLFDTK